MYKYEPEQKTKAILDKYGIEYPECGFYIGDGWLPIVDAALGKMVEAGWDKNLAQVKSKFCQLCIYIGNGNEQVFNIIREAEVKCDIACENCGEPHGLKLPMCGTALCFKCNEDRRKKHEARMKESKE